mgnify:CR=1 FL=1|tara:strand:- start:133 stop:699 length:567 start_codon:yes stop_codon:yes gene_type:complete
MKELNQKLAQIQTELKVKKSSYNSFGKYYFRKAEDILEAVKPFLLKHNVSVTIDEDILATDPVPMLKSTAIISDGENQITTTAIVGVDLNQKGMQAAQQFGAASSYGKKYALGNLFLIDDTQDADGGNNHGKSKAVSKIKQAAKPAITKEQLESAKGYMRSGGSIDAIETKYKLTDEQRKNLTKVAKR